MAKEDPNEQVQYYQQQLQSLMIQKESLKLQSMEIERVIEELNKTDQKSAYKIVGRVMISKPVEELKKELKEAGEEVGLRLKSLEKTEERIEGKIKELQPGKGG